MIKQQPDMNREIDLSVSTYGVARQYKYDVAILPWGATEPHNLHLPYMTDCILSHAVAVDAAERALKEYGVRCMVLPPVMTIMISYPARLSKHQ